MVATAIERGVTGAAVCATREADWPAVAALAAAHPSFVAPSFGLHPWWLGEAEEGWEGRLKEVLVRHPCAGVGESGVDKAARAGTRFEDGSTVSLDVQVHALQAHAALAVELNRPLTVHCVRGAGTLREALSSMSPSFPAGVVVHGWHGARAAGELLLGMEGVCLSLGLRSVLDAAPGSLSWIPLDRMMLETDAPDGLSPHSAAALAGALAPAPPPGPLGRPVNVPANLPLVLAAAAAATGVGEAELAAAATSTARRLFCGGAG